MARTKGAAIAPSMQTKQSDGLFSFGTRTHIGHAEVPLRCPSIPDSGRPVWAWPGGCGDRRLGSCPALRAVCAPGSCPAVEGSMGGPALTLTAQQLAAADTYEVDTLIPGDVFWCPNRTTVRGRHTARCGPIFCSQNAGTPTPTCSKYQTCSTILIPLTSIEELSDGVSAGIG